MPRRYTHIMSDQCASHLFKLHYLCFHCSQALRTRYRQSHFEIFKIGKTHQNCFFLFCLRVWTIHYSIYITFVRTLKHVKSTCSLQKVKYDFDSTCFDLIQDPFCCQTFFFMCRQWKKPQQSEKIIFWWLFLGFLE